ncbi:MAG: metabolite traffic protein EboE [Opitutaceae bacterium]
MRLNHDIHLAYCTNIHRGEDWEETFAGLERYTLEVRQKICPADKPYAIGLRLSAQAAAELSQPATLLAFQKWLEQHNCYVFTINGFPYGSFHNTRVKEQVYAPDWQTHERLDYTKQLFDLLVQLLPKGVAGSVSTVPGSFKSFIRNESEVTAMQRNLIDCVHYIADLSERHGCDLHLGLEPEPLGYLETTQEVLQFFERLHALAPDSEVLRRHLGVNYDTCHMAIQYERPEESIQLLRDHQIRISKLHLSSALKVNPTADIRVKLVDFVDEVYLHQVVAQNQDKSLQRWADLDLALEAAQQASVVDPEWRIHFHVPLHAELSGDFDTTIDHLTGVFKELGKDPTLCSHLEFETYTWEVLPMHLKSNSVVDQLLAEYDWCLDQLTKNGIGLL